MPITVTIRQGVAALGGLLVAVGLAVLLWPIAVTMDGPFGLAEQVSCGSALVTHDSYGGFGRAACAGPLGDQRTFGWPILLGGLLVAGTALLHARHPRLLHPEDRQRHTP